MKKPYVDILKQEINNALQNKCPENKGCLSEDKIPLEICEKFNAFMFGKTIDRREDGVFLYYVSDVINFYNKYLEE